MDALASTCAYPLEFQRSLAAPNIASWLGVQVTQSYAVLVPDFYRLVRTLFWLFDEGECVAEVGRQWVFGGEGVVAGADLDGAVAAGGADEVEGMAGSDDKGLAEDDA